MFFINEIFSKKIIARPILRKRFLKKGTEKKRKRTVILTKENKGLEK